MTALEVHAVEAHTVIQPLTRQLSRNIARKASKRGVRCRRCPNPVTDPTTAVLDNGQVSHRACAEHINIMVDDMNHRAATERLERAGIVLAAPNLITL